jgi:hypothetical protein
MYFVLQLYFRVQNDTVLAFITDVFFCFGNKKSFH